MIKRLRLRNWQTHLDSEFFFSPGVNGIIGVMGSGKSCVLDAICFALYGKFPALAERRVRLDKVITSTRQKKNEAIVELEFEKDGKTYYVKRKIKRGKGQYHAEVRENGPEGRLIEPKQPARATEVIEEILGIDYSLFSQVVYCEQNRLDYFLGLAPGERAKRIDELLRIERLEKARSSLVTLTNMFTNRARDSREEASRVEGLLKGRDIEKEKKELRELREQKKSLLREMEQKTMELEAARKLLEREMKKKRAHDELRNRIERLSGTIAELEARLRQSGFEPSKHSRREIEERLEKARRMLEEHRKTERELSSRRSLVGQLEKQTKNLEEKLGELEESREKKKQLETVSKRLEVLEDRRRKLIEDESRISTLISQIENSLRELEESGDRCIVCGSPLPPEKRRNIAEQRKNEKQELEKQLSRKRESIAQVEKSISSLKRKREELSRYAAIDEEIERARRELRERMDELSREKEMLEKLEKKAKETDYEKLEKEISRLEKLLDGATVSERLREAREQKKQAEIELGELGFDEARLEELKKRVTQIETSLGAMREQEKNLDALEKEKAKRIDDYEKQAGLVESLKKKSEAYENVARQLDGLRKATIETQSEMRKRFIESINAAMADFWPLVYPYRDYRSIRLHVGEGRDYVLQLLNMDGEWVDVEGVVSGGERMTAVLVLRLALSMVLASGMRILLLDEPTHNLDARAVRELANIFRERVSGLIDQVFLITHDQALEDAVTGRLYRLERGETKEDFTSVVEVEV